jgi:diguanylate cyclase (GGDEF)-like protein/PAS domain S-box-containing protein
MRLRQGYLLFAIATAAVYPLLPSSVWKDDVFYDALSAISVVLIVVGIVRNRPAARAPWVLLATGQALFVAGDLAFSFYERVLHQSPFPSAADVLYLAGYPVLAAGLMVMVRRRPGSDWSSLLDAAIATVGMGAIAWVTLIAPYTHDASLSTLEVGISLAYPLGDVLVLAVAARLMFGRGAKSASSRLLSLSLVAVLATDAVYGWLSLHNHYASGDPIDVGWLVSYALFALAALAPSMSRLSEPDHETDARFPIWRLAMLGAALATIPLGLALTDAHTLDRGVYVGCAAALIVLVLVRLATVIRRDERAIRNEGALRRAATALVQAPDRNAVFNAALVAALSLADDPQAGVFIALGPAGDQRVVAALGHAPRGLGERVEPGAGAKLHPLTVAGDGCGVLGIETAGRSDEHVGLGVLASQVSLALESRQLNEELVHRRGEERFRSLVQHSSDLIVVIDRELTVRYQTPSVESVLGYAESELVGRPLVSIADAEDVPMLQTLVADAIARPGASTVHELRFRRNDGTAALFELRTTNLLADPNVAGLVVTARDVTERKELEAQLLRKAFEDSLTGLPNGELFRNRLEHALARRSPQSLAVLFVDLDDFKDVNDSLGHAAGDALLVEAARRIAAELRSEDTAARLGGDEFAVLLEDLTDQGQAVAAAARLLEALDEPFTIDGNSFRCPASVGLAYAGPHDTDPERLIQQADLAMYQAKRSGKARAIAFDPQMESGAVDRLQRVAELRDAVERDELVLYYQPIVDLNSERIEGFEALVRWRHPRLGFLPPIEFIPLAERTGLIVPLGRWVLREACRQLRHWQDALPTDPPLWMSVNVSAQQLAQPSLVADVVDALALSGIEPGKLVLELTESAVAGDTAAIVTTMRRLKDLGVRIAIDDFGAGYSALTYLRHLPVDILKIDRQFVSDLGTDNDDGQIAATIVQLARILDLEVVAEGIEERPQSDKLRSFDCTLGQGFLHAPPLPVDEAEGFLRTQQQERDAA